MLEDSSNINKTESESSRKTIEEVDYWNLDNNTVPLTGSSEIDHWNVEADVVDNKQNEEEEIDYWGIDSNSAELEEDVDYWNTDESKVEASTSEETDYWGFKNEQESPQTKDSNDDETSNEISAVSVEAEGLLNQDSRVSLEVTNEKSSRNSSELESRLEQIQGVKALLNEIVDLTKDIVEVYDGKLPIDLQENFRELIKTQGNSPIPVTDKYMAVHNGRIDDELSKELANLNEVPESDLLKLMLEVRGVIDGDNEFNFDESLERVKSIQNRIIDSSSVSIKHIFKDETINGKVHQLPTFNCNIFIDGEEIATLSWQEVILSSAIGILQRYSEAKPDNLLADLLREENFTYWNQENASGGLAGLLISLSENGYTAHEIMEAIVTNQVPDLSLLFSASTSLDIIERGKLVTSVANHFGIKVKVHGQRHITFSINPTTGEPEFSDCGDCEEKSQSKIQDLKEIRLAVRDRALKNKSALRPTSNITNFNWINPSVSIPVETNTSKPEAGSAVKKADVPKQQNQRKEQSIKSTVKNWAVNLGFGSKSSSSKPPMSSVPNSRKQERITYTQKSTKVEKKTAQPQLNQRNNTEPNKVVVKNNENKRVLKQKDVFTSRPLEKNSPRNIKKLKNSSRQQKPRPENNVLIPTSDVPIAKFDNQDTSSSTERTQEKRTSVNVKIREVVVGSKLASALDRVAQVKKQADSAVQKDERKATSENSISQSRKQTLQHGAAAVVSHKTTRANNQETETTLQSEVVQASATNAVKGIEVPFTIISANQKEINPGEVDLALPNTADLYMQLAA